MTAPTGEPTEGTAVSPPVAGTAPWPTLSCRARAGIRSGLRGLPDG
ncbi:hypothetical protein HBB16_04025 [Pseudonocardia sp. MCCB 268]|nr:hypothetical protein [Pseudonocardia cytotoxica]